LVKRSGSEDYPMGIGDASTSRAFKALFMIVGRLPNGDWRRTSNRVVFAHFYGSEDYPMGIGDNRKIACRSEL